jgi:hypothetical protein
MTLNISKTLAVSIFFNILSLGILVGVLHSPIAMMFMPPFGVEVDGMPEHGKSLMKETLNDMQKIELEMRPQMLTLHNDLKTFVQKDVFDEAEFDVLRNRMRDLGQATMDKCSERIKQLLKRLTAQERRLLVNSMMFGPPSLAMPGPFSHEP